jgi:hypothetical protein
MTFFRKQAKVRKWRNMVEEIKLQFGEVITYFEEIKKVASKHFEYLYAEEGEWNNELCGQFISHIPTLIKENNLELNKPVSEDEIFTAIKQFNLDKAPGTDGFTVLFYIRCWYIIKFDFIIMVCYVHKSSSMGGSTNSSFFVLIPKEKNASSFGKFFPFPYVMYIIQLWLRLLQTN